VLRQRPIFLFIPPAWQRCRRHSPLPFRRFCLFFFFQEKEKQKEKQKRKMRPSFSPLFSFLFFFKKGKKGRAKGRCGVQGLTFSAIFVLFFVRKMAKEEQREESFLLALLFIF